MDLNSLALFAKVVKAGSFSEAARQLNMPIATVSRRVAELESQLGVCLLKRSTRCLRLTDIGAEVLEHAQQTAELREAVRGLVSRHHSDVSGLLRLAMPPDMDSLLLPVVCAFQEAYPRVRVQLRTSGKHDHAEDDIDLAFGFECPKNPLAVTRKLISYRHRLVASPAYLAKVRMPENPPDLLDHRLLAYSDSTLPHAGSWEFLTRDGQRSESLSFVPQLSVSNFGALATPLLAGAGIGELLPMTQPELLREGRLVEVMPQWQFAPRTLSLFHLRSHYTPRSVRLFKDFAIEMTSAASSALLM